MTIALSIVIPAYNETHRLGPTLDALASWIGARTDVEVVVVDDGSTDGTAEFARHRLPLNGRVLEIEGNRGKGHAVRTGMLAARGARRMFLDADGSTPVSEIDHLMSALDAIGGHGIAFGSIAAGTTGGVRQTRVRTMSGRLGNWLTRQLVLPRIMDTQRGCKVMSDCVAEAVFGRSVIDGWGFDVELLAVARELGFPLAEVPVQWSHVDGGHIRWTSYLSTLRDLFTIRGGIRSGRYEVAPTGRAAVGHVCGHVVGGGTSQPADAS
jgi:glycosyltransferase involved in cell wall biosynthesis